MNKIVDEARKLLSKIKESAKLVAEDDERIAREQLEAERREVDDLIAAEKFQDAERRLQRIKQPEADREQMLQRIKAARDRTFTRTLPKEVGAPCLPCRKCGKLVPLELSSCFVDYNELLLCAYCVPCDSRTLLRVDKTGLLNASPREALLASVKRV